MIEVRSLTDKEILELEERIKVEKKRRSSKPYQEYAKDLREEGHTCIDGEPCRLCLW